MYMTFKKKQAGVLLLEILAGLFILAAVITGIAMMINRSSEETQAAIAAQHMRTVGDAAAAYIRNNLPAILEKADADTPVLIKVSDLKAEKYLPDSFSSTNAYQQQTCVLVLEPDETPGQVTAMVVTEGGSSPLDDVTVNTVANLVGASGGAIRKSDSNNFNGSRNAWQVAIGNFKKANAPLSPVTGASTQNCRGLKGTPNLSFGHPAMALWLANGGINPDVIYRTAIPGRPDLNVMSTPLGLATVTAGDQCTKNINGDDIKPGAIASDNNDGSLLICQAGVWVKPSAKIKTVLRKSNNTPYKEIGKKGKAFYANCDKDNGEKLIIGSCSAYCHQFVSIGGSPHIVNGLAIGWKCGNTIQCTTGKPGKDPSVRARAVCSASKDPVAGDGSIDLAGIIDLTDDDGLPLCKLGEPSADYCHICNAADDCNICEPNSIPGLNCKAPN